MRYISTLGSTLGMEAAWDSFSLSLCPSLPPNPNTHACSLCKYIHETCPTANQGERPQGKRTNPADILIFDFQPPERWQISFCCLSASPLPCPGPVSDVCYHSPSRKTQNHLCCSDLGSSTGSAFIGSNEFDLSALRLPVVWNSSVSSHVWVWWRWSQIL